MTKRLRKHDLSESEIDALVIADAADPSAWGDPIVVPPSTSPRPAWVRESKHLELASKFYVLSVLHRLGADATLTFSQDDGVDITIVQESGSALTIDVKTLRGSREWVVNVFRARPRHYVLFVWYPASNDVTMQPTVYVMSSERLQEFLSTRENVRTVSLESLDGALEAWHELTMTPAT